MRVGLSLWFLVLGCEPRQRSEAKAIVSALERYEAASANEKSSELGRLSSMRCTEPATCEARDSCVAFARTNMVAVQALDGVKIRMRDIESGLLAKDDPIAIALPTRLTFVEALLHRSEAELLQCKEAVNRALR